jgi:hypothetical protein
MRRLGVTFAAAFFVLGTLASEPALARAGSRGGGSHGAGFHGGGHRAGGFHGGTPLHHGHGGKNFHHCHGGKHFHHGHGRVGVFVGAPVVFGGWAYASPYSYPPPGYWYYCPYSRAYYPYVQECPGPWQPVVPHPPAP